MIPKIYRNGIGLPNQRLLSLGCGLFILVCAQALALPVYAQTIPANTESALITQTTPPNLETLRALADQGHPVAQFNLGVMHDFGQGGLAQDHKLALQWYARAAAQGHAGAQFNLGGLYFEGLGAEKNLVRSVMWFTLAGMAGFSGAAKNRNAVTSLLNPQQLAQAQALVRTCQQSGFKDCG